MLTKPVTTLLSQPVLAILRSEDEPDTLDPPPPNRLIVKTHDPSWFVLGYAAEGVPQFQGHRVTGEVAVLPRAPAGEKWTHVGISEGQAYVCSAPYVVSEEALAKPVSSAWLTEHLTLAVGEDSEAGDDWIMTKATVNSSKKKECVFFLLARSVWVEWKGARPPMHAFRSPHALSPLTLCHVEVASRQN